MRITPRKNEVETLVEVLDADHDSVQAAAKAVLKRSADLFGEREFWTIATLGYGGKPLLFGLYSSENEAEKGMAALGMATDRMTLMRVNGMATVEARLSGQPVSGDCECTHAPYEHYLDKRNSRGACAMKGCDCAKFAAYSYHTPTLN